MIKLFHVLLADDVDVHIADALQPDGDGRIWVGEGPTVKRFERALEETYGGGRWLAMNSCTAALYVALHALDVGPGDRVVTTPLTCSLTNSVIRMRDAIPVWADVDRRTGCIDPADVAAKVLGLERVGTPAKAIMAVDFAGRGCDYDRIRDLVRATTRKECPPIIEDAAHLGPEQLLPNRGDWVALSFQGIKFLTTSDGGALLAPENDYREAKKLRWAGLDREAPGWRAGQDITRPGGKWHMTDVAASIGLANLDRARWALDRHRKNADVYGAAFADLKDAGITAPPPDDSSSWWLYVLLCENPGSLIQHLAAAGIEASPVHRRNDAHSGFSFPNGSLPGVDHYAMRQVAIPVGWWLSDEELAAVIHTVRSWQRP